MERERKDLELYIGKRRKATENLPFNNASNLDISGMMVQGHVESIHSRIMMTLEKSDPLIHFNCGDKDSSTASEFYFNKKINDEVGIMEVTDEWFREALIGGARRAKARWCKEIQKITESWELSIPPDAPSEGTAEHIFSFINEKLSKIFTNFNLKVTSEGRWKVTFDRDGKTQTATLTYKIKKDNVKVTIVYNKVTFNGVKVEIIKPEDFKKSKGPIQTCHEVMHRYFLNWNEVRTLVESGEFTNIEIDEETKKKFYTPPVNEKKGDRAATSDTREAIQVNRDDVSGHTDRSEDKYEFIEACVLDDFEGDGILEDRIITKFNGTQKIVRNISRSEAGYRHRPYSEILIQKIPGKHSVAFGVPSMIFDLAEEETAIHNLVMDASTLAAIKFYFYGDDNAIKNERRKIAPGSGHSMPLPTSGNLRDAIYIPDFNSDVGPLFNLTARLDQTAQSLDGVNETQLMKKPSPRTLGQSQIAQNELNIRFARIFSRCIGSIGTMTGLAGLLVIIADLYREFGDELDFINKTGGKAVKISLPKSDDFSITLNIDVNKLNEVKELQKAQLVLSTIMNPNLAQMKIVSPKNVYNAAKDLLRLSAILDPDEYLTAPPDAKSKTPKEENWLMLQGLDAQVSPADDDQQHIMEHQVVLDIVSKQGAETSPMVAQRLKKHIDDHQKQMQGKQAAQAQQSQMAQALIGGIGPEAPMAQGGGAPTPGQAGGPSAAPGGPLV